MSKYSIIVLPGDGIGPEVTAQAVRALEVVDRSGLSSLSVDIVPCAGSYYVDHGKEWPDGSYERCKAADAIMLGAIGHMDASGRTVTRADGELAGYEQVIGLRMKLDLYANLRPIKLYPGVKHCISGEFSLVWSPQNVDIVVFRENTEGAYVPGHFTLDRGEQIELVVSPTIVTRVGATRIVREAFRTASMRRGAPKDGVSRVTCVDKSNVIRAHRLFRDIFREVAVEFPDIEQDFAYVDAFCHSLIREPERYDVVVAPNLPGDIVTDLGAVLQGGMGMAASGNIGDEHAMFEPIHGSAPPLRGLERANPTAAILSASMMLNWLGRRHDDEEALMAGAAIEAAVGDALLSGEAHTPDLGGRMRTSEVGAAICRHLERHLER